MPEKKTYNLDDNGNLVDSDRKQFTFNAEPSFTFDMESDSLDYKHQNQGITSRCGDYAILNALNFLGLNDKKLTADDVRKSVESRRLQPLKYDEMLSNNDIYSYFLMMKRFRVIDMFHSPSDAEKIMRKMESNENASIAVCCYDEKYKKHFTSIIYKDNEYYLLDSLQHSEFKITKLEVKKHLLNSLSENVKLIVLAQL